VKNQTKQFCQEISSLKISRNNVICGLVLALGSSTDADSVAELSESRFLPHEYSSIYKAITDLAKDSEEYEKVRKIISRFCINSIEQSSIYTLTTDTTPLRKGHSACLAERTYIHVPNVLIKGNKPLDIGYNYSFINLSPEEESKWSLPVSIKRVSCTQTASQTAIAQLSDLFCDEDLPFGQASMVINTLDSAYGNPAYLANVYNKANLVNIVRMRQGSKVYPLSVQSGTGGAPKIYGEKLHLIEESRMYTFKYKGEEKQSYQKTILSLEVSENLCFETVTAKGKPIRFEVKRFNNMMIRTKKGHNMKDKPFDLLVCKAFDIERDKPLFKSPMWIGIHGEKKQEITSLNGIQKYLHRYDIEPFFRFAKQKMMLDKYQTPSLQNIENWMLIQQLTSWVLWHASTEVNANPKPWQKYLPTYQNLEEGQRLSMAQTRKATEKLFLTFDLTDLKPQKSKKGKPRERGDKLKKRIRHPVKKKQGHT